MNECSIQSSVMIECSIGEVPMIEYAMDAAMDEAMDAADPMNEMLQC